MRAIRVLAGTVAISVQRQLAHRADLLFEGLLAATGIAAGAGALMIVFTHVQRLASWGLEETIVLLGMFSVVSGLLETFVEPNLGFFAAKVTNGELDDLLLQPVPSLFLATLGSSRPWALTQVLMGVLTVGLGLWHLHAGLSVVGALAAMALLLAGTAVAWSYRVLLASLAFWAPGVEPSLLYFAFWQLGRYPVAIYHPGLRLLLTYLVPVALVATAPAHALTHGADPLLLGQSGVVALGAVLIAARVWEAGLRRYTGATS